MYELNRTVRAVIATGKEISAQGLSMSTTRIRAFLDIPLPKTITDLKKFLGVGNYFHSFIANHSAVTSSLHKMIEVKAKKKVSLVPRGINCLPGPPGTDRKLSSVTLP